MIEPWLCTMGMCCAMKAKKIHTSQAGATSREAVRRKMLLIFLENDTPAWKDVDHPELATSAAAWVRYLRKESSSKSKK
jgi:hypothetical protein